MEQLIFRKAIPLEHPRSNFKGFSPGTTTYPKGYRHTPESCPLAEAMIVERDVAVPLRDGVLVRVDIFRPDCQETVPAILCSSIFGKGDAYVNYEMVAQGNGREDRAGVPLERMSGFDQWEEPDPGYWTANHYAVIYMDPRGVGMSEGDAHYFGTQDAQDNYDVIEWLALQNWCNGRVTMAGNSWLGINQWFTAALRPPHLTCIAPWEGHGNMYRDEYMRGGIPHQSIVREAMCFGNQNMEDLPAEMVAYPLYTEFWKEKSADFEQVLCPAYVVASYSSQVHCNGTFEGFRRISSPEKWLRIHNTQEWGDQQDPENRADLLKFFDYYMKDRRDNGWADTPRVRLTVLDMSHPDILYRPEEEFPLARQQFLRLYLDPAAESLSLQKPPMARQGAYQSDDGVSRLRFTYTFRQETEVVGYIKLHAFVSADSARDMDLYAKVQKMDADGHYVFSDGIEMQYGGPNAMLRVSLRELDPETSTDSEPRQRFDHPVLLHPGEIVPIDLAFWPTGLKFHPGETLELSIAGFDYLGLHPAMDQVLDGCNRGVNRVHAGGVYDSYLQIPVIPQI